MPEALSARGRRTQFLGILIVGGLILVALVSAVLWLSVAAGTAAIFFCMGVSFFALLAVYAGKLIVDEERYMQARLEARDARYRQTLELLPEGVVILKGEDGVIEWVNTMAGVHLGIVRRRRQRLHRQAHRLAARLLRVAAFARLLAPLCA